MLQLMVEKKQSQWYNERILGKNVKYIFPCQNRVLTGKLQSNFPIHHCNEVLENYFLK